MPIKKLILSVGLVGRACLLVGLIAVAGALAWHFHQQGQLNKIIDRLKADSRAAEVLVVGVNYNEAFKRSFTTIKFLEYSIDGKALSPKYFTFPGNVIQFQSLVVRFDDAFVMAGDKLRGRSVYLFWKAFMLDGENTKEFPITYAQETPQGYKIEGEGSAVQERFWKDFWAYALDAKASKRAGIKNVQIEAPGTMFIPGFLYTIKIEHDGGLRIDTAPVPQIMRGETIK